MIWQNGFPDSWTLLTASLLVASRYKKTVSSAKTIWVQELPKSDTVLWLCLRILFMNSRNRIRDKGAAMAESNLCCVQAWLSCNNADTDLALVVQGWKNLQMQPWHDILKPSPSSPVQALTHRGAFNYVGDLCPWVLKLYHLKGGHGIWITKVFKVLLPLHGNIPISGQQFKRPKQILPGTGTCFHSSSQWMVCQNVQGLSNFLHLGFSFLYRSCSLSGHFAPVIYFSSPLGPLSPKNLFFYLNVWLDGQMATTLYFLTI